MVRGLDDMIQTNQNNMLAFDEPMEKRPKGRKDRKKSFLCYRGQHKNCKGRTCTCECHNEA